MKGNYFLISILLASLSACGGGGGDGGSGSTGGSSSPSPMVQITQSNGAQVAATAMEADSTAETVLGVFPLNSENSDTVRTKISIVSVVQMLFSLVRPSAEIVAQHHTNFCQSGVMNHPEVGGNGTYSFSGCVRNGLIYNGEVDISSDITWASFTFRNFTISTVSELLATFNGDLLAEAVVESNNTTLRLSGDLFIFDTADDYVELHDFILEASEDTLSNLTENFSYIVESSLLDGTVRVTTDLAEGGAPLQYSSGEYYPYAGAVVVIGANNTRVRVTAINPMGLALELMLEFDENGDGTYDDALTQYMTWYDFELLSDFVNYP